jgi:hypothetical protein
MLCYFFVNVFFNRQERKDYAMVAKVLNLEFENWNLFEIWDLFFGISILYLLLLKKKYTYGFITKRLGSTTGK